MDLEDGEPRLGLAWPEEHGAIGSFGNCSLHGNTGIAIIRLRQSFEQLVREVSVQSDGSRAPL